MMRNHEMVFVQTGMGLGGTMNDGLVVSEEYRLALYRDTKIECVILLVPSCSIAVLAALLSAPKVAVSTVCCFFENQSNGVLLKK